MKPRFVLTVAAVGGSLLAAPATWADDGEGSPSEKPPVVVPTTGGRRDSSDDDLKGAPPAVKKLVTSFGQTRDKYLADQRALLAKYKGATAEEREQIRQELQANRDSFLADMKSFRDELHKDLTELKGKISHTEFNRILDAAQGAAGSHPRKGKN